MRRDYYSRLSLAARWRMPPGEAEEFLADYQEILEANPRPEETLLQELGKPWTAARLAGRAGDYRRWLGAFAGMALCLLPGLYGLSGWVQWLLGTWLRRLMPALVLLLAGTAAALLWFRRAERGPLSRRLLVLLAVPPALYALVSWWVWRVLPGLPLPSGQVGPAARLAYALVGAAAAALGLYGLAAARVRGRRWRALYVISLTVAALVCTALMLLTSMEMAVEGVPFWASCLRDSIWIAGIGLVGTGVALC